MNPLYAKVIE